MDLASDLDVRFNTLEGSDALIEKKIRIAFLHLVGLRTSL